MFDSLYPLKLYLTHRPNLMMLPLGLLLNFVMWGWLLLTIEPGSEQLFLHYTILFGVDLIGDWSKIFFIPLSGMIIFLTNATIGWLMFKSDKFFSYVLNSVGVLSQVLLLIGTWLIVYLNV